MKLASLTLPGIGLVLLIATVTPALAHDPEFAVPATSGATFGQYVRDGNLARTLFADTRATAPFSPKLSVWQQLRTGYRQALSRWNYEMAASWNRRFRQNDFGLDGSINAMAHKRLSLRGAIYGSPTHRIEPLLRTTAGLSLILPRDVVLSSDYIRSQYPNLNVHVLRSGLEWYIRDFRFSYSLYAAWMLDTGAHLSHATSLHHYFDDNQRVGGGAAIGKEANEVGPGLVVADTVQSVWLDGTIDVRRQWSLIPHIGWQRQGPRYYWIAIQVGIEYRF